MATTNKFFSTVPWKWVHTWLKEIYDYIRFAAARQCGVIPSARLPFSVNPSNTNTIGIGTHTFRFVTALAAASASYTQVKIGLNAAATLASLLDAINGVTNANVVACTTAFSEKVVADAVTAAVLRLQWTGPNGQGEDAFPGTSDSLALSVSIAGGAAAWSVANLNATGKDHDEQKFAIINLTITAAMLVEGYAYIELPFTPSSLDWQGYSVGGLAVDSSDKVTSSGGTVTVQFSSSPHYYMGGLSVGDRLVIKAYE